MKVAVLSRDYMPLSYCDVKRAITLVYLNKAEIVKATDKVFRSMSQEFPIPKVIRLLGKMTKHFNPKVKLTRRNILIRDNFQCQYCSKTSKYNLTLDHILPVSRGGKNSFGNLVASCLSCNAKKASRTPEEAGMELLRPPKTPTIHSLFSTDNIWEDIL